MFSSFRLLWLRSATSPDDTYVYNTYHTIWSVIWQDISQAGTYFHDPHDPKAIENIA